METQVEAKHVQRFDWHLYIRSACSLHLDGPMLPEYIHRDCVLLFFSLRLGYNSLLFPGRKKVDMYTMGHQRCRHWRFRRLQNIDNRMSGYSLLPQIFLRKLFPISESILPFYYSLISPHPKLAKFTTTISQRNTQLQKHYCPHWLPPPHSWNRRLLDTLHVCIGAESRHQNKV